MTYEEAKVLFNSNDYQEIICHSKLCDYPNTGCGDCRLTDMQCRINEALEKQIPKKPKNRRIRTLYGDSKYHTQMVEEFTCPCCEERIMFRVNIKRCLVCGQAINWNEVE